MMTKSATAPAGPTPVGARHAILASNFLVLLLNYADRAAFGVATPFIIAEFGFSTSTFGWILSLFGLTYAPFGFLGGVAADKWGPRRVMGAAITVWSVFTAATAAGVGLVSFGLIRLCFGAGEGPQATVTGKLMKNWFPNRELGTAIGIANAATPLGGALGTTAVVAIMSATHNNWRIPFIVLGVVGLLFTVGWFAVVRDTPEEHRWIRPAELRTIRGDGAPAPAADVPPSTADEPSHGIIRGQLARPIIWTTALAFFGYSWILNTFLSWFPTYLTDTQHIDLGELAVAGSILWIGGFLGLVAGGVCTDVLARRTGRSMVVRKWTIVIALLGTAVLFGAIGLVNSAVGAVTLMSVVVFLLYFTGAQYWVLISDLVPASRYGSVAGAVQGIAACALILAPLATGAMVDHFDSWLPPFGVAALIAAVGALLLAVVGRLGGQAGPAAQEPREEAAGDRLPEHS